MGTWANPEHKRENERRYWFNRRIEMRVEIFEKLGGKCACPGGCKERRPEFMTIDHPKGGGREDRARFNKQVQFYRFVLNNYRKYRLLCANCNQSFGANGYCPHQHEKKR